MKHSFRKKRRFIPLFILGAAALAAGLGGLLMALWNEALVPAAGVATIGFWQAMGLLVLSRILLGGRFGGRWGHRHHWMREKWNAMSDAEKERFRSGCGRSYRDSKMNTESAGDVQPG